ncbi:MAG: hypothetical protein WCS30_09220 [Selenomonadaceae bacterium]
MKSFQKKAQKKYDCKKRSTWSIMSPITRKLANTKTYNRKKAQHWKDDLPSVAFFAMPHLAT